MSNEKYNNEEKPGVDGIEFGEVVEIKYEDFPLPKDPDERKELKEGIEENVISLMNTWEKLRKEANKAKEPRTRAAEFTIASALALADKDNVIPFPSKNSGNHQF